MMRFILARPVTIRTIAYIIPALIILQILLLVVWRGITGGNPQETEPGNQPVGQVISPVFDTTGAHMVTGSTVNLNFHTGRAGVVAVIKNHRFVFSEVIARDSLFRKTIYLDPGRNRFEIWALNESGVSVCLDSFVINFEHPRYEYLSRTVDRVMTDRRIIALTFDAGSGSRGADSLIDIITSRGLHLTFFLTGTFIRQYPEIVERLRENRQEIGNHTNTHPSLTTWSVNGRHDLHSYVNREFILNQLQRADSLYFQLTGDHMHPYWRAPFGEYNNEILGWAALAGYKHIGWSPGCDTRDWVVDINSPIYLSSIQIYEKLMRLEGAGKLRGAIILMHLNSDRISDPLYKILPRIIDELGRRGYQIMTISELLGNPPNV
jgi:peptidoglycan/xylan/chitin deacetylase (PgdA/CDA1 family)